MSSFLASKKTQNLIFEAVTLVKVLLKLYLETEYVTFFLGAEVLTDVHNRVIVLERCGKSVIPE